MAHIRCLLLIQPRPHFREWRIPCEPLAPLLIGGSFLLVENPEAPIIAIDIQVGAIRHLLPLIENIHDLLELLFTDLSYCPVFETGEMQLIAKMMRAGLRYRLDIINIEWQIIIVQLLLEHELCETLLFGLRPDGHISAARTPCCTAC